MEQEPTVKDYYKILGVERDATNEQLKKAYKKMALRFTYEKKNSEQEQTFKAVQEAYEVLSDPAKRHLYDTEGITKFEEPSADSIFQQFFGDFKFESFGFFPGIGKFPDQNGKEVEDKVQLSVELERED